MSLPRHGFGPSALATPANALTSTRLVASPVLVVLIVSLGPTSWLLWALWTALSISDVADGHLARRHGATRSGAFLDPLADKVLVLGALGALVGIGYFSLAPVVIIAAREVLMSAYRVYASRRGISVPARPSAKLKTLVQDLAVGFAFWPVTGHLAYVANDLLWAAVALTIYTGIEYVHDGRRLLRTVGDAPVATSSELESPAA